MVTVVTPTPNNDNSGNGFLVGVILLIIAGVLFFMYGLPMIQETMNRGVQVNVQPEEVKVNLDEPMQQYQESQESSQ